MTPVILPNLLASLPLPAPAMPEAAASTDSTGEAAAIDFSALLLAMLPAGEPETAPVPETAAQKLSPEPGEAEGKTETQEEAEPGLALEKPRGKKEDEAAAVVVMLAALIPVPPPVIPTETPIPLVSEMDVEASAESTVEVPATPRPETDSVPACVAKGQEAIGQEISPTGSDRAERPPVPADAAARAPEVEPVPATQPSGQRNAELAFAVRLSAPPNSAIPPAATPRAPELHLAVPPLIRSEAPQVKEPVTAAAPDSPAGEPSQDLPREAVPAAETCSAPDLRPAAEQPREAPQVERRDIQVAAQQTKVRPEPPPAPRAEGRAEPAPEPRPEAQTVVRETNPRSDVKSPPRPAEERPEHDEGTEPSGVEPRRNPGGPPQTAPGAMRPDAAPAAPPVAPKAQATRDLTVAAAMRAEHVEPARGRTEPSKAQAVRELSVVVPGRRSESGRSGPDVELRVVERTGDVRVSVRTGDSRLNTSLREDLPQLVSQLSERGYRAETWHPAAVQGAADGHGLRAENPEPARDGGTFGGHTGRGGSDTAGRDGNGGRRQQEQDQPEWLDALERSLGRGHVPPRSILR